MNVYVNDLINMLSDKVTFQIDVKNFKFWNWPLFQVLITFYNPRPVII